MKLRIENFIKCVFIFIIINGCLIVQLYAAPRQIVLFRHADKLKQELTGPALSAKGYLRALKASFYILNNFGEPDFVIAGKPKGKNASIRELQTIGPLVNILAERYPDTDFPILHPYTHKEYQQLANLLLYDKKFDHKFILICWRHTKIVELAKALGVPDNLRPWPDDDFDSVYIIEYDKTGKVMRFVILHNQYPIDADITWENLYQR